MPADPRGRPYRPKKPSGRHAARLRRDGITVRLSCSFNFLATRGDEPGPNSLRGVIERNAIALLSNYQRPVMDPPSLGWLGSISNRSLVRGCGLWNQRHVEETHDPAFLDSLEMTIERRI